MNPFRARSLQMRLATRLGTLYLLTTLILTSVFFYLSYALVETLSRRDLFELADELADGIRRNRINIDIDDLIADGLLNQFTHYAVFSADRDVLVSSDQSFVDTVLELDLDFASTALFSLSFAPAGSLDTAQPYQGLITTERSGRGRVSVVVAELERSERAVMASMIRDILVRAAWLLPLLILLTILVGVMTIRNGLKPLRRTAQDAASIAPASLSTRLGTKDLPSEIDPLVTAFNQALDRIEAGFEQQRRFTANAAHELRTPLSIISSAVDGMGDDPALTAIRLDIARMSRLVEQLLHVARLDSQPAQTDGTVDLVQIARQVLEQMAPLAIAQGHVIGLGKAPSAVHVRGDRYAIEDALRNLIENAIIHGSPANSIEIDITAHGTLSVSDHGPGIDDADKASLFDRFLRGRAATGNGAGLGLAIVREIMKHHGGTVHVETNEHGGSRFVLQFRQVSAQHDQRPRAT